MAAPPVTLSWLEVLGCHFAEIQDSVQVKLSAALFAQMKKLNGVRKGFGGRSPTSGSPFGQPKKPTVLGFRLVLLGLPGNLEKPTGTLTYGPHTFTASPPLQSLQVSFDQDALCDESRYNAYISSTHQCLQIGAKLWE